MMLAKFKTIILAAVDTGAISEETVRKEIGIDASGDPLAEDLDYVNGGERTCINLGLLEEETSYADSREQEHQNLKARTRFVATGGR